MAQAHPVTFYRTVNIHNVNEALRRRSATREMYQNREAWEPKSVRQGHLLKNYESMFLMQHALLMILHTGGGKSLNKPAGT